MCTIPSRWSEDRNPPLRVETNQPDLAAARYNHSSCRHGSNFTDGRTVACRQPAGRIRLAGQPASEPMIQRSVDVAREEMKAFGPPRKITALPVPLGKSAHGRCYIGAANSKSSHMTANGVRYALDVLRPGGPVPIPVSTCPRDPSWAAMLRKLSASR